MRKFFGAKPHEETARTLYASIVAQARRPEFFVDCGLPDTVDGRFDLLVLHVFLVMHRLKRERAETAALSQALFDVFFQDMDESLRELGAGDMGIGRRIKAMAEGFYGRSLAYEQALEEEGDGLELCIRRNLYGSVDAGREQAQAVAHYIRDEAARLAGQTLQRLLRGEVSFGPPPRVSCSRRAGGQDR